MLAQADKIKQPLLLVHGQVSLLTCTNVDMSFFVRLFRF